MNEACTLVIFGATGNLSKIKLLPALYQLERAARLAPQTRILGFGRRDWSADAVSISDRQVDPTMMPNSALPHKRREHGEPDV